MKRLLVSAITTISLTLVGSAFATTSTDDINYSNDNGAIYYNNPVTGTFNIVGKNGFEIPNKETVTDIDAVFTLDGGTGLSVDFQFVHGQWQAVVDSDITINLDGDTNFSVVDPDNDFTFTLNTDISTLADQLEKTGTLNYTISDSDSADTESWWQGQWQNGNPPEVDSADITVTWSDPPPGGVPDNCSTLALLGAALIGILGAARRFATAS